MPIHNYICNAGHIELDVYFTQARGGADPVRQCPECGESSHIHFGAMGSFNRLMTTQGHNQVVPDPQTGMYYENATDKKVKLKALGLEEGDRKTAGQVEAETWDARNRQVERRTGAEVLAADSIDELMGKVEWDKVDRGASGDLSRDVEDGASF